MTTCSTTHYEAQKAALSGKLSFNAQCAAIRKIIPWETIEAHLLDKKRASGTKAKNEHEN
jgi:hypothetical protein